MLPRPLSVSAPYFEVGFLLYLEKVYPFTLHTSRDFQTRVACGKLRLCTQASIRHSDFAGTAMSDVEWCAWIAGQGRPYAVPDQLPFSE